MFRIGDPDANYDLKSLIHALLSIHRTKSLFQFRVSDETEDQQAWS
jgi:hypothetical protein